MKRLLLLTLVVVLTLSLPVFVTAKEIEIELWHAMSGSRLKAVDALVDGFNAAHPGIKVKAQFTGSYAETMTRAIAAVRAGNPPHIIQVYEVGTQTMLDSGAIVPVYTLAKPGEFAWGDIIGPIADYYAVDGKMYSMPFNSSTAMLYYNKDIFRKAGLDPNRPPSTFQEVAEMGKKIVDSGAAANAISFGWPAWVFEQMHATHDVLYADNDNGRSGRATKVLFNQGFGVKVLQAWVDWAKTGVFKYGGREYSANQAFLSGQVAMLVQSTSSLASIEKAANFEVGTSFLPRMEGYEKGNSVIGGATLWVMKGHSKEELDAVWKFLKWVNKADVTIAWHKSTGYFPATNTAVKQLLDEGWFAEHPNHLTAFLQILSGNRTPASAGVLLGNFVQIRDIVDTALEKGFLGSMTPKQALDEAAAKCNQVLKEYNQLYQ